MKIVVLIVITCLLLCNPLPAQNVITFDNQGWSSDQSIDSNFTVSNFSFSSNKNLYTNYGYNFDVYNTSVYFVFQNAATDQISITSLNNDIFKLDGISAYQVSEVSTDTLIIEGWNGSDKKYTRKFSNITTWQILSLNYDNINKLVIKLGPSGNGGISDFNFDNFSFNDIVPVELIEFNASSEESNIKLEWTTATELNNYGFDIERTPLSPPFDKGGKQGDWMNIGFVKGNGTTTIPQTYSFSDNSVKNGSKYKYRLKQIDVNGDYKYSPEIEIAVNLIPLTYSLSQNYPNPFNPSTTINFVIPQSSFVNLKVYDILGNEVTTLVNEYKNAGDYKVSFDAQNFASGIYIYKLTTDGYVSSKKMILLH